MTTVLKYILWIGSTAVAFAGAWLFEYTQKHPSIPDRRRLTRSGRLVLPFVLSGFLGALALQIYQDISATHERNELEEEREALKVRLSEAEEQLVRLGYPLRPLRVQYSVTLSRASQSYPRYWSRIRKLIGERGIKTAHAHSTEDRAYFPAGDDEEEANWLSSLHDSVSFHAKNNLGGEAVFRIESPTYQDKPLRSFKDTEWSEPFLRLDFDVNSDTVTRWVMAPAALYSKQKINSSLDLSDQRVLDRLVITIYHTAKSVTVGGYFRVNLDFRRGTIVPNMAMCNKNDISGGTQLVCNHEALQFE